MQLRSPKHIASDSLHLPPTPPACGADVPAATAQRPAHGKRVHGTCNNPAPAMQASRPACACTGRRGRRRSRVAWAEAGCGRAGPGGPQVRPTRPGSAPATSAGPATIAPFVGQPAFDSHAPSLWGGRAGRHRAAPGAWKARARHLQQPCPGNAGIPPGLRMPRPAGTPALPGGLGRSRMRPGPARRPTGPPHKAGQCPGYQLWPGHQAPFVGQPAFDSHAPSLWGGRAGRHRAAPGAWKARARHLRAGCRLPARLAHAPAGRRRSRVAWAEAGCGRARPGGPQVRPTRPGSAPATSSGPATIAPFVGQLCI
jgi:hypothetical protein